MRQSDELVATALDLWRQDQASKEPKPTRGHGTVYEYRFGKCRCKHCKAAHAKEVRALREVRFAMVARGYADFAHGISGYSNWRCRCPICVGAERARNELRKARKAE